MRPALLILLLVAPMLAAGPAGAATGDRLDRSRLVPSFTETFDGPLDLFEARTNPRGRWTPCYWFGWRPDKACIDQSSRNVGAQDPTMAVDPAYNGQDPFEVRHGAVTLGVLRAQAHDPKTSGKRYGVGILTTEASFSQRYGYFEARITLPAVRGTWPAFWLLPANNRTPQEIDVMENMGVDARHILCTAHWQDGSPAASTWVDTAPVDRPHTYGLLWTAAEIAWYVDDVEVARTPNHDLHDPMYLIVSMGVGGWKNSGNMPEDAARILGSRMVVDDVRAYRLR